MKQADKIREYVLQHFVLPARVRREEALTIRASDIHQRMGLDNAFPAVCSVLAGKKLAGLAGMNLTHREGPENSSTTEYRYRLMKFSEFGTATVETELRRRFGVPTKAVDKIVAFETSNGKELALDREASRVQIWIESDPNEVQIKQLEPKHYEAGQSRHSDLPPRLNHRPPGGASPRPVAIVYPRTFEDLNRLLDWYDSASLLSRQALEQMKNEFLANYPDFLPDAFAGTSGKYANEERNYKDQVLRSVEEALENSSRIDQVELGEKLLDILAGSGDSPSNFLGWRTADELVEARDKYSGELEKAAAMLANTAATPEAVDEFVEIFWPVLQSITDGNPYASSRSVPTMLAALVNPDGAYGINYAPVNSAAKRLLGKPLLGNNVLTRDEYQNVLNMMSEIREIMDKDWGWKPKDFWDVQGFIWGVDRGVSESNENQVGKDLQDNEVGEMIEPTNLILYGPPGTGKTYRTTHEAVMLCDKSVPTGRAELVARYKELVERGQIEFVTFHQSYSYEEFVEGLRPQQSGADGQPGFELRPEPGLIKRVAKRARDSKGGSGGVDGLEGRQVFKMSLGEVANQNDAEIFDEALERGCAILGFADIDWSDARFENPDEMIAAYIEQTGTSEAITRQSGCIQSPNMFRNDLTIGDLVVVSKGNQKFRAIGEVSGEYEFVPREGGGYAHRRKVRWLWIDEEGVSVDEIYSRAFMMKTIYRLDPKELNFAVLERLIGGTNVGSGEPEQFVLIIDEINRANISKVFGELITLIEPDKRMGAPNELTVRLPYSGKPFTLPANLHIIGTMNTADRSIALLDTALRRRFKFRELMPDPNALKQASERTGVDLGAVLRIINERIEYLFDREHQVGHAYFIGCQDIADVHAVMKDKIIPLLSEYFYEDRSKVAQVLGDEGDEGKFLVREKISPPPGLGTNDGYEDRFRWIERSQFDNDVYQRWI